MTLLTDVLDTAALVAALQAGHVRAQRHPEQPYAPSGTPAEAHSSTASTARTTGPACGSGYGRTQMGSTP